MACYNPRRIWIRGVNAEGKKVTQITNVDDDAMTSLTGRFLDKNKDSYLVPCGQCIGCRLDYSKYWANRAYLESLDYKCNYFITLTYDDDHMPLDRSLSKKEWQLFMKRFRKYFNDCYATWCQENGVPYEYVNIRFLAAGEYGDSITFRPHYHAILFNCPFFDLDYIFEVKDREDGHIKRIPLYSSGLRLAHSKVLDNAWKHQGLATIAPFSWNTAAYVARYVVKKQKGQNAKVYDNLGIESPFMLSSRRPGLGYNYYINHLEEIYKVDEIYVPQGFKGTVSISKPGAYADKIHARVDEKAREAIRQIRKYNAEHKADYDNDLKWYENLEAQKNALESKIKILKRGL